MATYEKKEVKYMTNNRVLYQIKSLEKLIIRYLFNDCEGDRKELAQEAIPTPTQMQIIEYILEHLEKEIYQKDLEEAINVRRATISGVLQTMEKNKLIERVTDKEDTRTKKIILKEKARNIFKQNEKRMIEIEKIVVKDIPDEELKTFSKVIEKMKNNVKMHNTTYGSIKN